jgi:hypothetical protein
MHGRRLADAKAGRDTPSLGSALRSAPTDKASDDIMQVGQLGGILRVRLEKTAGNMISGAL